MMIHLGWYRHPDDLRDNLPEHHPQINLVNFNLYDVGVFNRCEENKDFPIVIKSWSMVHPMILVIPVKWDNIMPVEILCSLRPTEVVRRFLSAPETVLTSPKENAR